MIFKEINEPIFLLDLDLGILLGKDGTNSENSINKLLLLFEKYNIPATWAIVGSLFEEYPSTMGRIFQNITESNVNHEICYHSFLHINFSERGRIYAEAEIKKGITLSEKLGITFNSFIFPSNGIGHVDVLKEYRYIIYRGPNLTRGNNKQPLLIRLTNKFINQLISQPAEPIWENGIWNIPCSMAFTKPTIFPTFALLPRAKSGINAAIRSKKIFHTYIHPHEMDDPFFAAKLDQLLSFVAEKRDKQNLKTLTMGELGLELNKNLKNSVRRQI